MQKGERLALCSPVMGGTSREGSSCPAMVLSELPWKRPVRQVNPCLLHVTVTFLTML